MCYKKLWKLIISSSKIAPPALRKAAVKILYQERADPVLLREVLIENLICLCSIHVIN